MEARFILSGAGLEILHPLLNVVQPLLDAHQAVHHVVVQPFNLVGKGPDGRGHGRALDGGVAVGCTWLVVVAGFLQREAPLIAKLYFTDSLSAEGAVDLASRRVALLGRTVVLDASAIAYEVVARGLFVTVVGRSKLDDSVPLVFGDALH